MSSANGQFRLDDCDFGANQVREAPRVLERGQSAPILFPTIRNNLLISEMELMPSQKVENQWRSMAKDGQIPREHGYGAILNKALATPPADRKPHEYLFDLARVIVGRHLAFRLPILTLQAEDLQELEWLREGVLCLALVDTVRHPEWFDRDALTMDLENACRKVKHPDDSDIFGLAAAYAEETPITLTEEVTGLTAAKPDRLVLAASIAFYLHRLSDGKPFTYPSERLGNLWGYKEEVARRNGRTVLRLLENAGLVEVVSAAVACHRSIEYRFCEKRSDLFKLPTRKAKPRR